ncbi:MAG: serine/threonine protein kinase, partial [Pseudomonadota bacterium]|nr:serine/threonine protein kinase [Pseudomonadota bacterium]
MTQTSESGALAFPRQCGGKFLPSGTALLEFDILDRIGEGGFSFVYLANDRSLRRTVALKEYMPPGLCSRASDNSVTLRAPRDRDTFEAGLRNFINEARLLAQFDHPALLKVYRSWEGNGTAYMAMPYCRGISLERLVRADPAAINERWLKRMLAIVMDGLETLHVAHCYHRDISPDNVQVLDNGMPLLLDFGAARRIMAGVAHGITVILKPGYAPVEQYADDASIPQGPWTDIYALSAVVYFCVTGKAPVPSVAR